MFKYGLLTNSNWLNPIHAKNHILQRYVLQAQIWMCALTKVFMRPCPVAVTVTIVSRKGIKNAKLEDFCRQWNRKCYAFYHCISVLQYRVILVLILACLETSLAGWIALIELCPLPARESSYKVQHPETICSRQKTGNKAQAHNFISQSNLEETYVSVCEFNLHNTPRWLYVSYSYRLFTICVWISFQVTKQKYFVQLMPTPMQF